MVQIREQMVQRREQMVQRREQMVQRRESVLWGHRMYVYVYLRPGGATPRTVGHHTGAAQPLRAP